MVKSVIECILNTDIDDGVVYRYPGSHQSTTSPLAFAVSLGLYRIVEILLEKGAQPDVEYSQDNGVPILFYCLDSKLYFRNFEFPLFRYKQIFDLKEDVDH